MHSECAKVQLCILAHKGKIEKLSIRKKVKSIRQTINQERSL